MLVIEGPDMVGKTTLADKIRKTMYKMGHPAAAMKFGMESKGIMSVDYLRDRIHRWTVCDRMHASEVIYAMARGDRPRLAPGDCAAVDGIIAAHSGMMVVIVAKPNAYDRLIALHHKRGEDYSIATCRHVNAMYRQLANEGGVGTHRFTVDMQLEVACDDLGRVSYVSDEIAEGIAAEYVSRQG